MTEDLHGITPEEQKWLIQVEKMKAMFPFLVEEDFHYDYGMKEVMLSKLQKRLGKDRIELNDMWKSFAL